jgi:hypothetical protein
VRLRPREFRVAGARKMAGKGGVSLPPYPWGPELGGARPALEEVELAVGGDRDELVRRRARVWRTVLPPMLRNLSPIHAAALLDFGEAVERAASCRGGSVPLVGGGRAPGPRSPSLAAVAALERLRAMRAALDAAPGTVEIVAFRGRRDRFVTGRWRVRLFDVAFAAAVEGLSRVELAQRIAGQARSGTRESVTLALFEAAQRLARTCGYDGGSVTVA